MRLSLAGPPGACHNVGPRWPVLVFRDPDTNWDELSRNAGRLSAGASVAFPRRLPPRWT